MSLLCLRNFNSPNFNSPNSRLVEFPLLEEQEDYELDNRLLLLQYAGANWPRHYRNGQERIPATLRPLLWKLMDSITNPGYPWLEPLNKERYYWRVFALTPHIFASAEGLTEIVQTWLDDETDLDVSTMEFEDALEQALLNGQENVASMLLEHRVRLRPKKRLGILMFRAAVDSNCIPLLRLVLDYPAGIELIAESYSCLVKEAAASCSLQTTRLLLDYQANFPGDTAVDAARMDATWHRRKHPLQLLMRNYSTSVSAQRYRLALHTALSRQDEDVVRLLLNHSPENLDDKGTILERAILFAPYDTAMVRLLLNDSRIQVKIDGLGDILEASANEDQEKMIPLLLFHFRAKKHTLFSREDRSPYEFRYDFRHQERRGDYENEIQHLILGSIKIGHVTSGFCGKVLRIATALGYRQIVQSLLNDTLAKKRSVTWSEDLVAAHEIALSESNGEMARLLQLAAKHNNINIERG